MIVPEAPKRLKIVTVSSSYLTKIRFAISTSVSVTPNTKMRILNITPEVEMSVRERILIEKSSEVVQLGTGVLNDHTHLRGIIIIITTPFWEGVLIIIMGMKNDLGSMLESEREKRRLPMKKLSMSSPNSNQSGREIKITKLTGVACLFALS